MHRILSGHCSFQRARTADAFSVSLDIPSAPPVTDEQFLFAGEADSAFALQDEKALVRMAALTDAPLPWVPPAAKRWLCEKPDTTGLGQLQKLVMEAVRNGDRTPRRIFKTVSAADTHPLFWGDTTLWAKINSLADRNPPLVSIEGPSKRLPKWESSLDLDLFTINLSKT